ncbi:hypothetical protein FIBSPDRAFT_855753 [Athelia psychrophila]|uniref:DRBM domain-containing protein n=1 Tax=Athelia psychrophila TaxID=1759441 RepID=A0A166P082_9AGAM|nr:hypothetical protein FIBSPDRAFT_855753 [Fibularhizoctonia sp. CBS 109695]
MPSACQDLHNYFQAIYRNSSVLTISVQEVARCVWRADVYVYGSLYAQATGPTAHAAKEEAAWRALVQHRGN